MHSRTHSRKSSFHSLKRSPRSTSPHPGLPVDPDRDHFVAMPYAAHRTDTPSPVLSNASLPRQDRARVEQPHARDKTDVDVLQAAENDCEANYKPRTLKFWMVMIGLYCALFLVALVCDMLVRARVMLTSARIARSFPWPSPRSQIASIH
jgi:hypothetical protein